MTREYHWENNDPQDLNADITTSGQARVVRPDSNRTEKT
jgi:hypothetical protein